MNYQDIATRPVRSTLPEDVEREIERLLRAAKRDNRTLHTGLAARRLGELYPDVGIDHDDLRDQILLLAIAARVPTQLNSAL